MLKFYDMVFNNCFLESLLEKASLSERNRQHFDLRNSCDDTSQRMLNALLPGTLVPIHRHEDTAETVICLKGKVDEILYEKIGEDEFKEISRTLLSPKDGIYGMQVPVGVWHTVEVIEKAVIFEAKDGSYVG